MKKVSKCWRTPDPRCPYNPGRSSVKTLSMNAKARAICLLPLNPYAVGARWLSPHNAPRSIGRILCSNLPISTILRPNAFVVLDNLNTHRVGSFYEAFEPAEARRLAQRFEFHYTPKHGSWLNMAEIELSVLNHMCLDQRFENREQMTPKLQFGKRNAMLKRRRSIGALRQKMHASN